MKILLIQAGMPELRRPYDVVEKGQLMMPAGLGYLGAVLKEKGLDVRVKDYLAEKFDANAFTRYINDLNPCLVGISSYSSTYNQALKIAHCVKNASAIPIVMGGLHVSFLPDEALRNSDVDFVIRGEGEKTLPKLIDFLNHKIAISSIKGLSFKDKNRTVHNEDREDIHDLDSLRRFQ